MAKRKNKPKAKANPTQNVDDSEAKPSNKPSIKSSTSRPRNTKAPVTSREQPPIPNNKMGRRHKTPKDAENTLKAGKDAVATEPGEMLTASSVIEVYGPVLARKRLEREGFHPQVSSNTPTMEIRLWKQVADTDLDRPSRDDFVKGAGQIHVCMYTNTKWSTGIMKRARVDIDPLRSPLLKLFDGAQTYGGIMAVLLAKKGIAHLDSFAMAEPGGWGAVTDGMAVWDSVAQDFVKEPSGNVFLALTPEYLYKDLGRVQGTSTRPEAVVRSIVAELAKDVQRKCGRTGPYWSLRKSTQAKLAKTSPSIEAFSRLYGSDTVMTIRSLPAIKTFEDNINTLFPRNHIYQMSNKVAWDSMVNLLKHISQRKNSIKVLYLQKLPLLDRRILAVILRACPDVEMLGIYECPLIHIGDVSAILDLIHEINKGRLKSQPLIRDFDFYPRFHTGTGYETDSEIGYSATYGITWTNTENDILQRGLMAILLEATLKSRRMGIGLLMDQKGAFRKYLDNLPLQPLQIMSFLDGLYRYLDLVDARSNDKNAMKRAYYDMSKAIRMGLENLENDWPEYYCRGMGETLMFCSSCGRETMQELFTIRNRALTPWSRKCSACCLRRVLDLEEDHEKDKKFSVLNKLFPEWAPLAFNHDAPLHRAGHALMRLKTTDSVRPDPPPVQIIGGEWHRPTHREPLVRDQKLCSDSVQNLPSLEKLLTENQDLMEEVGKFALFTDLDRMATHQLSEVYKHKSKDGLPALRDVRRDAGRPGHFDERQILNTQMAILGYASPNFSTAKISLKGFKEMGYI